MKPRKSKDKDVNVEIKSAEELQAEVIELRERVEALSKEKDEIFGQLQRVSADYANYQKRVPKQVSDSVAWEKERMIRSVLPVLDNFEHTLSHGEKAENVDAMLKGVAIIYDQMLDMLKSHGVEQTHAKGEMFDPSRHEAMMRRSDPEQPDGVVLEEFQKGYQLSGRVIRPSKVIVNKIEAPGALARMEPDKPGEGADMGTSEGDQGPAESGDGVNTSDSE